MEAAAALYDYAFTLSAWVHSTAPTGSLGASSVQHERPRCSRCPSPVRFPRSERHKYRGAGVHPPPTALGDGAGPATRLGRPGRPSIDGEMRKDNSGDIVDDAVDAVTLNQAVQWDLPGD